MRNIREMNIIQIDITNVCTDMCSNCTRFCGHYAKSKLFFMDQDYFQIALQTLEDFDGIVGIIGGEPTLHPKFEILCNSIALSKRPIEKIGLWSNTRGNFYKYLELIKQTFGYFNLNDHVTNEILHTPILVASIDCIQDISEREKYIDNCWLQLSWSASINPKGAYFCEVAGALALLFNGPDGIDIKTTKNWWQLDLINYQYQIDWACQL
jgi:hypothetical protein